MKGRDDRTSGPKPLASSPARRVEAIIEGAEKAAERVIDEAEASARAYLAEAKAEADRTAEQRLAALAELTDALVAQADAIRRQSELLTSSLREAKARLEGEAGVGAPLRPAAEPVIEEPVAEEDDDLPGGPREAEPRAPRLSAVESVEPPEPVGRSHHPAPERAEAITWRRDSGGHAGARLLATQMAVSGSSREEIAARLRTGFEIEDADAILDAILGPEA